MKLGRFPFGRGRRRKTPVFLGDAGPDPVLGRTGRREADQPERPRALRMHDNLHRPVIARVDLETRLHCPTSRYVERTARPSGALTREKWDRK